MEFYSITQCVYIILFFIFPPENYVFIDSVIKYLLNNIAKFNTVLLSCLVNTSLLTDFQIHHYITRYGLFC